MLISKKLSAFIILILTGIASSSYGQQKERSPQATPKTAEGAQDTSPLKFRSQTQLVMVPVIVTDKDGKHVGGLTQGDFVVYENGKPRKIASFEQVATSEAIPRLSAVPVQEGEFTNQVVGGNRASSMTVLLIDAINTPAIDQKRTRDQIIKSLPSFVDSGRPTALVVMGQRRLQTIFPFTSDPMTLITALKNVANEQHQLQNEDDPAFLAMQMAAVRESSASKIEATLMAGIIEGKARARAEVEKNALELTLESFQQLAAALMGMPGRKSVIWLTAGSPFDPHSSKGDSQNRLQSLQIRTMRMLNDANIAIYPIDVRGLADTSVVGADIGFGAPHVGADPTSATGIGTYLETSRSLNAATHANIQNVADATGGRAFYNRNDTGQQVTDAVAEGASYYMLTYYLDRNDTTPGWRKLKVKVAREGLRIRTRDGFVAERNVDPTADRDTEMYLGLRSPLACTGLPLTVKLQKPSAAEKGKSTISFDITIPTNAITLDEADGNRLNLEIAALAISTSGKEGDHFGQTLSVQPNAEQLQQIKASGITYRQSLDFAPGTYIVRFVVRDNLTGKMGSVVAPVTVK